MGAQHTIPFQHERIRTLVVDDSRLALRTICSCLEDQPAVQVVATATDPQEALLLAEVLRPDLVLLDLQMPGMNGLQVAAQLAKEFPAMLVIIVTAFDTPRLHHKLSERGVFGVVAKQQLSEELPAMLDQIRPLFQS
jgi:two-component system, NarL family, response regulator DesR